MAFTYDSSDFTDTADGRRNQVRFNIQDTDSTDPQFDDNEINHLLDENDDNVLEASIDGLDILIAKWARAPDLRMSKTSIAQGKVVDNLSKARDRLVAQRDDTLDSFAGGQTISGKEALRDDTDAVQPRFNRGDNDIVGLGRSNNPEWDDS